MTGTPTEDHGDPNRPFPLRGGGAIPWGVIAPHAARVAARHGAPLPTIAKYGGLSAFEVLMLVRARPGATAAARVAAVEDLTLTTSGVALKQVVRAWRVGCEQAAEAAMLAAMEEGNAA